ncbi:MAG: restriction endonuclease [Rhodobacteraceae bacterium]|nr:restriction endonuclease [Paracoccaceae bacterium]
MFDTLRDAGFDIMVSNHAEAILSVDFPEQARELTSALLDFSLPVTELIGSGGGEAPSTQRLRRDLTGQGWGKHNFRMETVIDGRLSQAQSHEIDHVRRTEHGVLAMEIEWNNKDPFFDRDLETFQRLHAQSVISLGIILTRGASLQAAMFDLVAEFIRQEDIKDEASLIPLGMKERTTRQRAAVERAVASGTPFAEAFARPFVADKYGQATTHWAKLTDRVKRGVGNPCPLLLIGIPARAVTGVMLPQSASMF